MSVATELQAGPEMDAEVARRVFGADNEHLYEVDYSTDIAAAWLVVEKMREMGFDLDLTVNPGVDGALVKFRNGTDHDRRFLGHSCSTAPLAICRAALAALGDD